MSDFRSRMSQKGGTMTRRLAGSYIGLVLVCFIVKLAAAQHGHSSTTATSGPATAPAASVKLPRTYRSQALGIEFGFPAEFVVTRWPGNVFRSGDLLANNLVLIEAESLAGREPTSLQPGSAPAITLGRLSIQDARVMRESVKDEWRTRIGTHVVYKLPSYPGPFGNRLHCYLVERDDDGDLILIADRFIAGAANDSPTHYDWVLERIIGSYFQNLWTAVTG